MQTSRLAGIIGNILEHYDAALFGLLAPFIAPLFFGDKNPLTSLILTYGLLCLGIVAKPLGALYFGKIGDQFGRRKALFFSLTGMAVMTIMIGCLPTYERVGILSPILLALARLFQSFCAAGETTGGAIFVLEHTQAPKRTLMSSLYDASSIAGILLGSLLVTTFSRLDAIEQGWRYLFWIGGLVGSVGILLRMQIETPVPSQKRPLLSELFKERKALLRIVCVSGFSYAIYGLVFTLMNGFVPLVTGFSKTEAMELNTLLLICDMFLLPLFGIVAQKVGKEKLMLFGICSSLICIIPLFLCLKGASLSTIFIARSLLVMSGVAFAAPYHAWSLEQVPPEQRYKVLAFGNALGSQIIGLPTAALSLWLYHKTGWILSPALYLVVIALLALFAIKRPQLFAKKIEIQL